MDPFHPPGRVWREQGGLQKEARKEGQEGKPGVYIHKDVIGI